MSKTIPHTICYFWDNHLKPLPDWAKANIESWKQYLPGYEIIQVDDTNFDLKCNCFVSKALEAKKYEYVADYIRLAWIYQHGGLYFDLDVTLIRDMRSIVEKGPFFGMQRKGELPFSVNTGSGFGSYAGDPLLKELMEPYEKWSGSTFLNERSLPNVKNCLDMNLPIFEKHGFKLINEVQCIDGHVFYPPDYFDPIDWFSRAPHFSKNTYSVHSYSGGTSSAIDKWVDLYWATLTKKGTREISYKQMRLRMALLHPFKSIRFSREHKKSIVKK
jgi:hypothetical protein